MQKSTFLRVMGIIMVIGATLALLTGLSTTAGLFFMSNIDIASLVDMLEGLNIDPEIINFIETQIVNPDHPRWILISLIGVAVSNLIAGSFQLVAGILGIRQKEFKNITTGIVFAAIAMGITIVFGILDVNPEVSLVGVAGPVLYIIAAGLHKARMTEKLPPETNAEGMRL